MRAIRVKDSLLQTVTFRRGSYSADDIGYRSRRLAGRDLICNFDVGEGGRSLGQSECGRTCFPSSLSATRRRELKDTSLLPNCLAAFC